MKAKKDEAPRPYMSHPRFFVAGKPEPKGSARGFINRKTGRVIITGDNPKESSWKERVHQTALQHHEGPPTESPFEINIEAILPRPENIKKRFFVLHTKKPDGDKLVRSILDALTHVFWKDDAQVYKITIEKRYTSTISDEAAGVMIQVIERCAPPVGAMSLL
jgi:Holliday junction resolvase RusA-like endonuclease